MQTPEGADAPASTYGERAAALARLIAEGRLAPPLGVTCRGRKGGAGSQAMAFISAMATARFIGCRYFHSPFGTVAHAEGSPTEWAQRWESFLNLGDGEPAVPSGMELVRLSDVLTNPTFYSDRPIVIAERRLHVPSPDGTRITDGLRSELRAKYWRGPKASIPLHRGSDRELTVALHLRRGDVSRAQNGERYVPDQRMLHQIARLKRALAPFGRPLRFNLYSEGEPAGFRIFAEAGCGLYISTDPFETFHNMVAADILVGAYSMFSYAAALLSEGIVLDHRVHAPAHSGWISRRGDGDISIKRLRRALLGRMGWRERWAWRIRRVLQRGTASGR
ncbi:MAG TPA: hypothetical protein VFG64_13165 [Dongiaceae bacterium]|nr:hypothetical protein [Dongiaceae bacterium]